MPALHLSQHIDRVRTRPTVNDLVMRFAEQDQILGTVAVIIIKYDTTARTLPARSDDVGHLARDHARFA
jgi:hypothetical protein